jgi:alpha-N-arabinofuranosidase
MGERGIPSISASASVDKEGKVHISIANLNPNKEITLTCPVVGDSFKSVSGEVLTAKEMAAFNTFEKSDIVEPVVFNGFKMKDGILTVTMPAKSVVVLELKK